jgi:hypothetical protein
MAEVLLNIFLLYLFITVVAQDMLPSSKATIEGIITAERTTDKDPLPNTITEKEIEELTLGTNVMAPSPLRINFKALQRKPLRFVQGFCEIRDSPAASADGLQGCLCNFFVLNPALAFSFSVPLCSRHHAEVRQNFYIAHIVKQKWRLHRPHNL